MAHNIDTMAYHGPAPWHGLGHKVPERASSEEMIAAAGLNWVVEKRPLRGGRRDAKGRPVRYELLRKASGTRKEDVLLALVSNRYEPLQNKDAFRFFDDAIGEKAAIFETAGALGEGERVWVLAKLPGTMRVVGDDVVDKYLLLSNSHNGRESVTVRFTPIRVVCQNTLLLALSEEGKSARVRHTKSVHWRMREVPELLGMFRSVFESAEQSFQKLARTKLDTSRFERYLERVLPLTEKQKKAGQWPKRWDRVLVIFDDEAQRHGGAHTLWQAYNAIAQDEDYRTTSEASPDRRLERVWFGAGAALKMRALDQAEKLAIEWAR